MNGKIKFIVFLAVSLFFLNFAINEYKSSLTKTPEIGIPILSDFNEKKLNLIEVKNRKKSIKAEKFNDNWMQTYPVKDYANVTMLKAFSKKISTMSVSPLILKTKRKQEDYGFTEPQLKIKFRFGDFVEEIWVGSVAFDSSVYIKKPKADQIFIGDAEWSKLIDFYDDDFRLKELYEGSKEIKNIKFVYENEKLEIIRDGDSWRLSKQKNEILDNKKVHQIIDDLRNIKWKTVISEKDHKEEQRFLSKMSRKIIVTHNDESLWEMSYSSPTGNNVYALTSTRSALFSLPINFNEKWKLSKMNFIDQSHIFKIERKRVYRIVLTNEASSLDIVRTGRTWSKSNNEPGGINSLEVEKYINFLQQITVISKLEKAEALKELLNFKIYDKSKELSFSYTIYEKKPLGIDTKARYYISTNLGGSVYYELLKKDFIALTKNKFMEK